MTRRLITVALIASCCPPQTAKQITTVKPPPPVETQAAASYTAWQMLEAGVVGTRSLDDKAIANFLKTNRVDTLQGKLRFNGPGNFGDDLMRVKQIQNGKWVVVWPKEVTSGGAKLLAP